MMKTRSMGISVLVAVLIVPSHGGELLKSPKFLDERFNDESLRNILLEEIESSLGKGSASKRMGSFEVTLSPLYHALPKNKHGKLGRATVRYALHRFFVMRHGWNIDGIRPAGESWNSFSSPVGVLTGQVPSHIEDMLEERLGGTGFGLHELAVLAATIEHVIHNDTMAKVGVAFDTLQISRARVLSEGDLSEVMDAYLMAFILGKNLTNMSRTKTRHLLWRMPEIFTGWQDARDFVRRIRGNITQASMDFAMAERIAERLGEDYGSFQNIECQQLKHTLMQGEHAGTGRIKLADFYKPALNGSWQFQESYGYLRQLGCLDESNPTSVSVIIANYLHSQTNCLAATGLYSICCKDECEGLIGHLESKLVTPTTKPSVIAELVSMLPSSTVPAPRKLSSTLLDRLNDIASEHGGEVPLHGRLFAQWMHFAFPRECPYPHLSGTTSQQTPTEWLSESGSSSDATQEEILQFTTGADATTVQSGAAIEDLVPWSPEEEVLVVHHEPLLSRRLASTPPALRSLVLLCAAFSFALAAAQGSKALHGGSSESDGHKLVV